MYFSKSNIGIGHFKGAELKCSRSIGDLNFSDSAPLNPVNPADLTGLEKTALHDIGAQGVCRPLLNACCWGEPWRFPESSFHTLRLW